MAGPDALEAAEQSGSDEAARHTRTVQDTARYVYADGQYRLREGSNPIEAE